MEQLILYVLDPYQAVNNYLYINMKKIFLLILFIYFGVEIYGQVMFQKTYGSTADEIPNSIKQTSDKGYIIYGTSDSAPYLFKIDTLGNLDWTKKFGSSTPTSPNFAHSVDPTYDGGYILTSTLIADNCLKLINTNATGDTIWTKKFGGGYPVNYQIFGNSVRQTIDSGYVIAGLGRTGGTFQTDDAILIKTDKNGTVQWSKNYHNTNNSASWDFQAEAVDVKQTSDGGYVFAGNSKTFYDYDLFVVRTNSLGDTLWTKSFNTLDTLGAVQFGRGKSIQETSDGGFIVSGSTDTILQIGTSFYGNRGALILKLNSSGNISWSKMYYGNAGTEVASVHQTNDGGYIIGLQTNFSGQSVPALIKTNSSGDTLWTKTFGVGLSLSAAVTQTQDGGYIVPCYANTFGSDVDICIIKTDSMGNSSCISRNKSFSIFSNITITDFPPTQVLSPGFIIGNPSLAITSGGALIGDCINVAVSEITDRESTVLISPNPFNSLISIAFSTSIKHLPITIINIVGEVIYESTITSQQSTIDLSNFSNGIYFVRMQSEKGMIVKKIIKY